VVVGLIDGGQDLLLPDTPSRCGVFWCVLVCCRVMAKMCDGQDLGSSCSGQNYWLWAGIEWVDKRNGRQCVVHGDRYGECQYSSCALSPRMEYTDAAFALSLRWSLAMVA
jgi:hypothetical protein